jgi:hypothetical protein
VLRFSSADRHHLERSTDGRWNRRRGASGRAVGAASDLVRYSRRRDAAVAAGFGRRDESRRRRIEYWREGPEHRRKRLEHWGKWVER